MHSERRRSQNIAAFMQCHIRWLNTPISPFKATRRVNHAALVIICCKICPRGVSCRRHRKLTVIVIPHADTRGARVGLAVNKEGKLQTITTHWNGAVTTWIKEKKKGEVCVCVFVTKQLGEKKNEHKWSFYCLAVCPHVSSFIIIKT